MEINLSEEMIEKITYVSAGRLSDLKAKEEAVKNSMAVGETQIRRKRMQLKDIEKAKADAEEVYALFLELLEELHDLLKGKIGKYVAMTIRAAVEVGVMSRPYFSEVKAEFVEVGDKSGYNNYYNKVEAYDKNLFVYVKEKLLKK